MTGVTGDGADRPSSVGATAEPREPGRPTEPDSIVGLVFQARGGGSRRRAGVALGLAVAVYGGGMAALRTGLGPSSTAPRARIPARQTDDRPIEVSPPPPAPIEAPAPAVARILARPRTLPAVRQMAHLSRPVAPAQAAAVITRAAESPVDLTGATFATGHAAAFPGGETAGAGRSTAPVMGAVDLAGRATDRDATGGGAPGRARAVRLAAGTWACPWPVEADSAQIDAQTVVIRVRVRQAGGVDDVEVVSDPGTGFGAAAAACARQTLFEPARDASGAPIAAWSPPIRVHFFR